MRWTERAHAPTWRAVRRAGMVQTAGTFLRVWMQIAAIWLGRAVRGWIELRTITAMVAVGGLSAW